VGGVEVEYLPILGRTDVKAFIEGQSHLVSSYPKAGM